MSAGDTLLKIGDYPFVYGMMLLFLKIKNIEILSSDATPYLLAAGIGATFLLVVDPVGRLVKIIMMGIEKYIVGKKSDYENILKTWENVKSAFHTQSIEKEKDKIVNLIYFLILLSFIIYAAHDNTFYANYFKTLYQNDTNCGESCSQNKTIGIMIITGVIIGGIGAWNGARIFGKVRSMAVYLYCKNSISVSPSSIQSMNDVITLGDWETVHSWKNKVISEYLQEEELSKERQEKLRDHISRILNEFSDFKKRYDNENGAAMLNMSSALGKINRHSLEQTFKEFPLYDSLIEHLYTNDDHEIFDLFLQYIKLELKMGTKNDLWETEKDEKIKKIITLLKLRIDDRRDTGMRGEDGQFINTEVIKHDLDLALIYDRKQLFPIRQAESSKYYQVRFFDTSTLERPRDDVVALLNKDDAEILTVELGSMIKDLRESLNYDGTDKEERMRLMTNLQSRVDDMLTSFSIMAEPLKGSCQFCRNSRFFNKTIIENHQQLLKTFPNIELDKDTINGRRKKRTLKDAIGSNP